MRKKDEILSDTHKDITNPNYSDKAHLWLEVRKIEILIDIRDLIRAAGKDIQKAIWNMPDKD